MYDNKEPPFIKDAQLERSLDSFTVTQDISDDVALPGFPRIKLKNKDATIEHLHNELWCDRLEAMARHLWLMSTPSSTNITPLHRQGLRGREVVVMEDPGLHLTWRHKQIFIKPLPKYLMSFAFWDQYLPVAATAQLDAKRSELVRAALGFLRSYYYLIQHESDFFKAKDMRLVPEGITWEQFCRFSETFSGICDERVSKRYEYGELRLSRLNLWAMPLLHKMAYQDQGLQYSDYFSPHFGLLLFVFGAFTLVLSAMQVGLAAGANDSKGWFASENVCRWFAMLSIFICIAPVAGLILVLFVKLIDECVFALRRHFAGGSLETRLTTSSPKSMV